MLVASSQYLRSPYQNNGLSSGVLLLLGALIQQQCQERIANCQNCGTRNSSVLLVSSNNSNPGASADHQQEVEETPPNNKNTQSIQLATSEDIDDDPEEVIVHSIS